MIYSEYDQKLLRENILHLREKKHLLQKRLAIELHMAPNTISQYETGKRPIKEDTIRAYSEYFGIPIETLLTTDLSQDPQGITVTLPGNNEFDLLINTLYPLIRTEEAMEDPMFRQGFTCSEQILSFDEVRDVLGSKETLKQYRQEICAMNTKTSMSDSFDRSLEMIERAMNCFRKVQNESLRPLVSANLLRLIGFKFDLLTNAQTHYDYNVDDDGNLSYTIMDRQLTQKLFEIRNRFVEEYSDEVFRYIKNLKAEPEYAELGDYYLALHLLLDFNSHKTIDEAHKTSEEISKAGFLMMTMLSTIDNPYADAIMEHLLPCIS